MEDSSCNPFFINLGITVEDDSICTFGEVDLEATTDYEGELEVTYEWDFGVDAVPATASGVGPHTVYYETSGTKTVVLTATLQSLSFETDTEITVSSAGACLGQIVGSLEDDLQAPMVNYNLLLFNDADEDGIADGASVRNVFTNVSGGWSMASLPPGHYLLVANLVNYTLISAIDANDVGTDGVVDTFTILPNNNAAGREAFKIFMAPGAIQGNINLIATTP